MAKAVGLDAGEFEVKVVELDGSYRRPRLAKVLVEPVAAGSAKAEDTAHAAREAEATHAALQGGGFSRDNLSMAFPCREAVLRTMTVPFVGEDQIRKVIKFEAEGSIHSHNVDDMVVDFYVVKQGTAETQVLMAALPKAPLRTSLAALERVGIEPMVVDLDTMALYRVAQWCGAFQAPPAQDAAADALVAGGGPPCSFVLDLGARSTRVLVVVNGELVDMRALRTGADSIGEDVAAAAGVALGDARDAVNESLRTDTDFVLDLGEDESDEGQRDDGGDDGGGGDGGGEAAGAAPVTVERGTVLAARDRYLSRLRRELIRFLTGVPAAARVESVWVTGGASRIEGVEQVLAEVFGVPPKQLDVLAQLNHKLGTEEAEALGPKLAVAVGLALRALGGPGGFNFRQEDLAFTKGFDRIKFPLAITCMLALFLVLVIALRARRELTALEQQFGALYSIEETTQRGVATRRVLFNGYLGTLVNSAPTASWFATDKWFPKRDYQKLIDTLLDAPVFNRLAVLESTVHRRFVALQAESGYYPELRLSSGLGALCELAEVLMSLEDKLGRYQVHQVALDLPADDKSRKLSIEVLLRSDAGSDFRQKGNDLVAALRAAAKSPASAFRDVPADSVVERFTLDGEEGYVVSIEIELEPESSYPVFPKAAP